MVRGAATSTPLALIPVAPPSASPLPPYPSRIFLSGDAAHRSTPLATPGSSCRLPCWVRARVGSGRTGGGVPARGGAVPRPGRGARAAPCGGGRRGLPAATSRASRQTHRGGRRRRWAAAAAPTPPPPAAPAAAATAAAEAAAVAAAAVATAAVAAAARRGPRDGRRRQGPRLCLRHPPFMNRRRGPVFLVVVFLHARGELGCARRRRWQRLPEGGGGGVGGGWRRRGAPPATPSFPLSPPPHSRHCPPQRAAGTAGPVSITVPTESHDVQRIK